MQVNWIEVQDKSSIFFSAVDVLFFFSSFSIVINKLDYNTSYHSTWAFHLGGAQCHQQKEKSQPLSCSPIDMICTNTLNVQATPRIANQGFLGLGIPRRIVPGATSSFLLLIETKKRVVSRQTC